ncbi:MAG TPA: ribonucleotide-diphosphate reductase subunit beta, partial [Buchnera sp. (in: enterobacteria)]|nr:ribonucleotide-diphosphate reductase subunit beta [Buchnera sp. (in: enterobacteria)]
EKKWAEYLFQDGSMLGLNKDILCQYIEYITNIRMKAIGLKTPFPINTNPIPWINFWLNSDHVQNAPQEVELSSYLIGQIDSSISDSEFNDFKL